MEELSTLIERTRAGDTDAYAEVVRQLQDMAVGYGYTVLGDFHLAQDAAQEAFVEAYRDIAKLREPRAFTGWLRAIIFKHCDRLVRGKRPVLVPLDVAANSAAGATEPAMLVEQRELQADVQTAIRALPPHERAVVVLFYINQYSYREIAAFLELPLSTVKNRLHAARNQLREHMLHTMQHELSTYRLSADTHFHERIMHMLTIAPDRTQHTEPIFEVLGKQWPHANVREAYGRITESHYDWTTARIGVLDGQAVTHFGVYDITMRIGAARVRTAGVQLVTTDPQHRDQGLMTETAQAALDAMRANGYNMSVVLRANDDSLYKQLGYVFAWPETSFTISVADLPTAPASIPLQEITPAYRADLAEIYNRENEFVTGTAVRPTFRQTKVPGAPHEHLWVWADAQGQPLGYVQGGPGASLRYPNTFWHTDSAGDPTTRLQIIRVLAQQFDCEVVFFDRQPVRGPLGRALRGLNSTLETRYRARGGWLIRIINLRATMEKLAPELSHRLALSHMAGWRGALRVEGDADAVTLHIAAGQITVGDACDSPHAVAAGPELAQLLVGTDEPAEIVAAGMQLHGDAAALVAALFPTQNPQMCNEDL